MNKQKISAIISPSKLEGKVNAISSKSYAHRAIILAGLAKSKTKIYINEFSKDIEVTINCLKNLGVEIKFYKGYIEVSPRKKRIDYAKIDLVESGSSLRFFTACAPLFAKKIDFIASESLAKRPNQDLIRELSKNGLKFSRDYLPFSLEGEFKGGNFNFSLDKSSQFISAVLLAGAFGEKPSRININGEIESKAYIDMTIETLKDFGIEVKKKDKSYFINPKKSIEIGKYKVEGDWSNGAFFLVGNSLGNKIEVKGLNENSIQADRKIIDFIKTYESSSYFDISQCPDLGPILAILLQKKKEKSFITNAKRLRIKESNRLIAIRDMINNLGGKAQVIGDSISIEKNIIGGRINSYNDHRIVMAAAIGATFCQKKVIIDDCMAVNKSYPNFFNDFKSLGGKVEFRKDF